ncbi:MAG TPA: M48 family metallopeptidase [Candidatus Rifleibacterium sp.]|nr:M48 family metallopeptidase [Candidatus Rifleibacterium sp.]
MKFVARLVEEDENINVSPYSTFSAGLRVMFQVVLLGLGVYLVLGLLVDFVVPYIPPSWEDALAAPIMEEVSATRKNTDNFKTAEIQQLLDSLADKIENNSRKFKVSVVVEKDINALALPGGHIVIYSELLEQIESENELAMVLAHELGHFVSRDHLRGLGRSFLFFIVANVFLGDSSATKSLMNSSGILQNNYSREQEYAADAFALHLLVKHYGHSGGASDFFTRLAARESLPDLVHYLSTHPASAKRIKAIEQLTANNHYQIGSVKPVFWKSAPQAEATSTSEK